MGDDITIADIHKRLGFLESHQSGLSDQLGEVQRDLGHLTGMVEGYIGGQDRLDKKLEELCAAKHGPLAKKVEGQCKMVTKHEDRIRSLERTRTRNVAAWSTKQKVIAGIITFLAYVASVIGADSLGEWLRSLAT